MGKTLALFRKEIRETSPFFFGGFAVVAVCLLTLLNASSGREWARQLLEIVEFFAWLFAIIAGVSASTRDLRGRLEEFWRSRPIPLGMWFAVKFSVGLAAACFVPALAVAVQRLVLGNSRSVDGFFVCGMPVTLTYSASFLLGTAFRAPVPAALLSLAVSIAIYALPIFVPSLEWLGISKVPTGSEWFPFAGAYLGASIGLAALSFAVLKARLRLEAGQKVLAWTLGLEVLAFLVVLDLQVGTNLPVLERILLSPRAPEDGILTAVELHVDADGKGIVIEQASRAGNEEDVFISFASIAPSGQGFAIGPSRPIGRGIREGLCFSSGGYWQFRGTSFVRSPHRPDRGFFLERSGRGEHGEDNKYLCARLLAIDLDARPGADPVVGILDLAPTFPPPRDSRLTLTLQGEKLIIATPRNGYFPRIAWAFFDTVAMCDVRPRDAPLLQATYRDVDFGLELPAEGSGEGNREALRAFLPSIPGLSPRDRLELEVKLIGSWREERGVALEGDILAILFAREALLEVFRLIRLDEGEATFERVGQRRGGLLERLTEGMTFSGLTPAVALNRGLLYAVGQERTRPLTVYDLRDASRPRMAGHFAEGDAPTYPGALAPLADGRVLVGGTDILVIRGPAATKPLAGGDGGSRSGKEKR